MKKMLGLMLLLSCVGVFAAGGETWEESASKSIKTVNEFVIPDDWFKPVVTKPIKGSSKSIQLKVKLAQLEKVWLVVDSNGSNGTDHACWGSACFLLEDGSKVWLSDLKPLVAKVGYGSVEKGTMQIGGVDLPHSIFAHAHSALCYEVKPEYKFFQSTVGLRASAGGGGNVIFKVLADETSNDTLAPIKSAQWKILSEKFPVICQQLSKDFPNDRAVNTLFSKDMATQLNQAATKIVHKLGFDYSAFQSKDCLSNYGNLAKVLEKSLKFRTAFLAENPEQFEIFELDGQGLFELKATVDQLGTSSLKGKFNSFFDKFAKLEATFVKRNKIEAKRLKELGEELHYTANMVAEQCGWPTAMGNNQRNNFSPFQLNFPLYKNWQCQAVKPEPAWPAPAVHNPRVKQQLSPTLTFDRALYTVGMGRLLYFSSTADNTVYALDAGTGKMKWRFVCGAPVRMASYLYRGRVYVGADDGILYCLSSKSGQLIWKRAAKSSRYFVGNGRLMSRQPIRCGICIEDNKVYFTTGLFPSEDCYLVAVDATTGKDIWEQKIDVSPQGFLLSSPSRLFLPTGRTPFIEFNRTTGKSLRQLGNISSWGSNLVGGSRAIVVEDKIVTGPSEGGQFHLFSPDKKEKIVRSNGLHMIIRGRYTYILGHKELVAIDRGSYLDLKEPKQIWSVPVTAPYAMILSGSTILCGGNDKVFAFSAVDGRKLWTGAVEGKALGLSIVNGQLIVSTDQGLIYSFSSKNRKLKQVSLIQPSLSENSASSKKLVETFLSQGDLRKGFIFSVGIGDGKLVTALANSTAHSLKVVCWEKDSAKVKRWRERFTKLGLYGLKIEIINCSLEDLPKYCADYLVNSSVTSPGKFSKISQHLLRPAGGVAYFLNRSDLQAINQGSSPKGTTSVREKLTGSGDWVTTYGDNGNSACSKDKTNYTSPEVLWFGRPGAQNMIDRHDRNTPPIYKDGMMFISGLNYLYAVNAYNGTVTWESEFPSSARASLPKSCGNMVVDDFLYVAQGSNCSQINKFTGEINQTFKVPMEKQDWAYLALTKSHVIGSSCEPGAVLYKRDDKFDYQMTWYNNFVTCSNALFGLNRQTGEKSWLYKSGGVIANPAIGIENNLLFFVESGASEKLTGKAKCLLDDIAEAGMFLTAVDTQTGEKKWSQPIKTKVFEKVLFLSVANGIVVVSGSQYTPIDGKKMIRYEFMGYAVEDGKQLWTTSEKPSYDWVLNGEHGEQTQHPMIIGDVIYGPGFAINLKDGTPYQGWKWSKSHKCATVCGSTNFAFSRFTNKKTPNMFNLKDGKRVELTKASRPGCWINILPVGGLILIPEFSAGCTCSYSIQTSMGLIPVEDKGKE